MCCLRLCKTISLFDVLFFLLPFLFLFFPILICLGEFARYIILTRLAVTFLMDLKLLIQ